jgi:hypothetical protein
MLVASLVVSAPPAGAETGLPAYERILDGIPLFDGMGPVERPWLGGWQTARPQLADADGDGDPDLFVFEELGKLRFYRNAGTPAAPVFAFETDRWGGVHELAFGRVVDMEGDGDLDLLCQAPEFETEIGGQTVLQTGGYLYTNVGSSTAPILQNLSSHPDGYLADVTGAPIPMVTTAPDLVDLEGDGDRDLVFGDPTGAIILYRNVGTAGSAAFQFETDHYQDLLIVFGFCGTQESSPVPLSAFLAGAGGGLRHGYMLFSFFDVDADGLADLFLGDQFNSNVYFLENLGGSPDPMFACRTQDYFPTHPDLTQYLLTAFADLDGDMDPDALVGSGISSTTGIFHYRNDGSVSAPSFAIASADYVPELDLGFSSAPAFADLDGGGVPDLFLGSGYKQALALYGNQGTAAAPAFALEAPAWLPLPAAVWAAPEFCDLDADGDLDRFVGVASGGVRWWRNTGTPTSPAFQEILDDPAFGDTSAKTIRQRIDAQAIPRFLDDEGDGDLDLVVGSWSFQGTASLVLFRNDGTPQQPAMVFAASDWRGLGALGAQIAPAFADQDGDGDPDLVIGRYDGTLVRFENEGTPAVPAFPGPVEDVPGVDVGVGAVPVLVNLDDDGDPDLAIGESGGGLNLFRSAPSGPAPPAFALVEPAPAAEVDGRVSVRFDWEDVLDPATGSACTYELRLAGSTADPPTAWRIVPGLAESQVDIRLHEGDFRFRRDFVWTVAARGVRAAPVPPWRAGVHATWDALHGDPEPPGETDPESRSVHALAVLAHPVPARGAVTLSVTWPAAGAGTVEIFDLLGRRVATLRDDAPAPGERTLAWDARDARGGRVAAGVYLVRARHGTASVLRRLVILR